MFARKSGLCLLKSGFLFGEGAAQLCAMQRPASREHRSCFTSLSASEGRMAAAQVNVDYDSVQSFIFNCLHDADVTKSKTTRLLAILWSFWFD